MTTLPRLAAASLLLPLLLSCQLAAAADSPLDVVVLVDMQPNRRPADRLFTTNMDGSPRVNRAVYPVLNRPGFRGGSLG